MCPIREHTTFMLWTPAGTMTINDKIVIFSNDVNKTRHPIKLLVVVVIA